MPPPLFFTALPQRGPLVQLPCPYMRACLRGLILKKNHRARARLPNFFTCGLGGAGEKNDDREAEVIGSLCVCVWSILIARSLGRPTYVGRPRGCQRADDDDVDVMSSCPVSTSAGAPKCRHRAQLRACVYTW